MALTRWLELRGSRILALRGSPDRVCVELEGYIQQWEGVGTARIGTRWLQHVLIEIDFPDVDQGISAFPAVVSRGDVTFEPSVKGADGGLSIPMSVEAMISLELVTPSGQMVTINGERLRTNASGEPKFIEAIRGDTVPEGDEDAN